MANAPKKSGYRIKVERGLVPFRYDPDSRSHKAGAEKNWRFVHPTERNRTAMRESASRLNGPRGHVFPA